MKYILELNSRANLNETAESKHNHFMHSLRLVADPWGIGKNEIPFPGFGKSETAIFTISKYLGKGIKCTLFYCYRNMLGDRHSSDDRVYAEFNAKKIDYAYLVNVVFPQYIKIFNAYSARIFDEEIILFDFDKSRDKNRRNTVIRFYPVHFMDRELCKRALKLTPTEVMERLKGYVERVEIINDGVLIIKSSNLLTIDEANEFDIEASRLLGIR